MTFEGCHKGTKTEDKSDQKAVAIGSNGFSQITQIITDEDLWSSVKSVRTISNQLLRALLPLWPIRKIQRIRKVKQKTRLQNLAAINQAIISFGFTLVAGWRRNTEISGVFFIDLPS